MSIIDSFPKKGKQQNNLIQYTPIGTIIAVMGTSAPNNYLICDGSVYNIVDYPELANYFQTQFGSKNYFGGDNNITFAVPDLRGEFLRGAGTNSHANQGNGSSVGTHQNNGAPEITGVLDDVESSSVSGAFTRSLYSAHVGVGNGTAVFGKITFKASDSNSIYGSSDEIRPTNTSVLYCIAYKDYVITNIAESESIDSINDIEDVNIETPSDNEYLGYNETTSQWENKTLPEVNEYTAGTGIDINDNEVSIDAMPAEDMTEIITPLPIIKGVENRYSTKEQIIGEWVDGKPIYQKVITGFNEKMDWIGTQAYTRCTISAPIQDVEFIINARIFMSNNSNGNINWSQICNISFNETNWTICALEDYYFRVLIVQYTKTTD